ncbi:MAG: DMT family transporter [Bacteroidales bacterium]|nr:DMT family transporter [Bacteroidales bacterium]MCB9027498.1 DMT family transporter [Bacteroidales bacterium]HPE23189.1 DMT family transporter [Bacteroidales bacterium]HPJ04762.1 DMT family transporter [Bacteroidales bacterium]HRW27886.1 DMT family transporter [Bacteroidales bacterium]
MTDRHANTIIWAIITCLMWSTAYPFIKVGLQYSTPVHFAGTRFLLSGLMILPFTVRPREYVRMLIENRSLAIWVTLLQVFINYILFYLGMDRVPGALGAVIVGSQPFVTAIVSRIMIKEERFTRAKVTTIILGLAGIVLVSAGRQGFRFGLPGEMLGIIMIFIANISTATSNVLVSKNGKNMNPLVLSSFSLFVGGAVMFLLSFGIEDVPGKPDFPLRYWMVLIWLSFMSAFTFSRWYVLLKRPEVKVSELNLWKFIIPVFGAILSWIIVPGENPDWVTIAGMVIISVSLIWFFGFTARRERKVEEVPAGPMAK